MRPINLLHARYVGELLNHNKQDKVVNGWWIIVAILLAFAVPMLSGCGLKGDLYRGDKQAVTRVDIEPTNARMDLPPELPRRGN